MSIWYRPEERAMYALRQLYRSHGYLPFRMSKFEEYDLYAGNKDFLVSSGVITFNDHMGRLLALKPDVTLSIVKNYTYLPGQSEKVCYSERVYRPSGSTGEYKEIPQTGLECLGDPDPIQQTEVVLLAARSMALLGGDSVLELSHMGILSAILEESGAEQSLRYRLSEYLSAKNEHDLRAACEEAGIDPKPLIALCSLYGSPDKVLPVLGTLSDRADYLAAVRELEALCRALSEATPRTRVLLDFSIAQDMRYYSGIVFRGYLAGIPERVLSGGRYDPLLRRMGKQGGAVGFALYLDLLEQTVQEEQTDADLLLLYEDGTDPALVLRRAEELSVTAPRVMIQKQIPERLRFGQIVRVNKEGELT